MGGALLANDILGEGSLMRMFLGEHGCQKSAIEDKTVVLF